MNKEILNKIQSEQDYPVKITFEVICDSDTSMQEGESIKERILGYIDQCTDAMDDSIGHWGDHSHDIEPMKVELYDEDENLIDVTNDVLGEERDFTFDELCDELNELLKRVKKYSLNLANINYPALMDKPDDLLSFRVQTTLGKYLHTDEPRYGDPTYWIYPEGVEEKIEDNKTYKVWYSTRDASDPYDSTTWNSVKYIKEVINKKQNISNKLLSILNLLQ